MAGGDWGERGEGGERGERGDGGETETGRGMWGAAAVSASALHACCICTLGERLCTRGAAPAEVRAAPIRAGGGAPRNSDPPVGCILVEPARLCGRPPQSLTVS